MYIIIVNPSAGNGRAERLFRTLQNDPVYKKTKCRTFVTKEEGHAENIVRQVASIHSETIVSIIVVGGDGTLHEVMNGLQDHREIPVSILPAGTGNDFARGADLNREGVQLFHEIIQRPKPLKVQLGTYILHQRYKLGARNFINSISFGIDGIVVSKANNNKYRRWLKKLHLTKLTYPLALLRSWNKIKPIQFELEIDGETSPVKEAMMVIVSNHPYYGGGMKISPGAKIQRSIFQVTIVKPVSKKKLFLLFLSVFAGRHVLFKEVKQVKASTVSIRSEELLPFQVDGQDGTCTECFVKKASPKSTFYVDQ
ncbi:diacylglycerol/lipid kinase family protein [Halobacillus litoralis]|uniref:diacylglycerol/lipid kinase family protein n=1 Tax=Halobacillus litoralis TaxID=45668 RepID=UPI001CFDE348|nr:diacylglycerol kinase family protein [Halobacillus litoralis]